MRVTHYNQDTMRYEQSARLNPRTDSPGLLKLARILGLVFHPFLVSPLAIVLLLWLELKSVTEGLKWAGICSGFVVLPALLYLRIKLKSRAFSDSDVSVREERFGFYLFGGACMLTCCAALVVLHAPKLLLSGAIAGLSGLVVAYVVNRFWTKLSIHAGVMAGTATAVSFTSLPLGGILFGLTLIVCWARWISGQHTLVQLSLGIVVAVVCVIAGFAG